MTDQDLIKQQAAEIARLNDALNDALGNLNDLSDLKNAEITRLTTGLQKATANVRLIEATCDRLDADTERKDALLRDALDVIERAPWKNWRTDKAITNIKEELKC